MANRKKINWIGVLRGMYLSNVLQNIYHETVSLLFSLNLKQDLTFGVLLVIYIHFLYVWLAHIIFMLGAIYGWRSESCSQVRKMSDNGGYEDVANMTLQYREGAWQRQKAIFNNADNEECSPPFTMTKHHILPACHTAYPNKVEDAQVEIISASQRFKYCNRLQKV